MNLCDVAEIRALLARQGFRFSKSMGQNFLVEEWVPREIAAASGAGQGVGVLEIGPGIGPLTAQLSDRAERVAAVELDRSLLPVLAETMAGRENVTIIPGDVLKLNLRQLCREQFPGLSAVACANLPYNITTPALTALLESGCFQGVTVLIQREVAQRICAAPGSGDYSAFSVFCQYYARCTQLFDVPPSCFYPAPKVVSSVLRMDVYDGPPVPVEDPAQFFRVVRASFAQRRKTLRNGLSAAYGQDLSKEEVGQVILDCGLPENVRGERLGLEEFAALAKKLSERLGSLPPHLA